MLVRKLSLLGIEDVEAFCGTIVERSRLNLRYHEREELHAFLIETAWELSLDYKPGGASFSTYAGTKLRLRVVDWQRARFGRSRWTFSDGRVHERKLPELVSLDRLDEPLAAGTGDSPADWLEASGGLLAERDRNRARDLDTLGLEAPGRAA